MEFDMKKWLAGIILVFLVIIDQVTKYIAKLYLEGQDAFSVFPNIFEFCYLEGGNTGAAFGLFRGNTFLLSIISLVVFLVIVGCFWHISKKPQNKWLSFCLVFMAAGAFGNWIDRFFRGYVIDFLYFKLIDFPIFNVADCYVTISAIILIVLVAFSKEEEIEK
ncbi:MAG: signal peptidase II [Lachnospiraceae bacterium]|nr:signal peptidase II [Lachnospiraceae bacterium]